MSQTLEAVKYLVAAGDVRFLGHGYDELAEDCIADRDIISGLADAVVVEDYPNFPKGSAVLVLQYDHASEPIHAVWGIPKGRPSPAVLVADGIVGKEAAPPQQGRQAPGLPVRVNGSFAAL